MDALVTTVGRTVLRNPIIAGPADHFIDDEGVRRAIKTGVGAVVLKSVNETQSAKDQLQSAEYAALDEQWRPVKWGPDAPLATTIANRTGLGPASFEQWLDYAIRLDREARAHDTVAIASIIFADMEHALSMARQIEQAGLSVLELNIGTPYAREAKKGTVTTELDPARVEDDRRDRAQGGVDPDLGQDDRTKRARAGARRRGVSRRRRLGDHGGPPARPHPRRRDVQADARHGARHRRLLEPAAHLLLARGVARAARAATSR